MDIKERLREGKELPERNFYFEEKNSEKSSHPSLREEYPFLGEEKILGRFKQNNPRHRARLASSTRVEKVDNTAGSRARLR